jgi:APA family basic amino acid/polyamine antiporter
LFFIVEYLAWFIGWNSALLYQLAALTVVVGWGNYVIDLTDLISNYNASRLIVQAPIAWQDNPEGFYVTGQIINLPAIAITIAITVLLVIGIRETAMVNMVLVVIKIILLLIFIFVTCGYVNRDNYKPFFPANTGNTVAYIYFRNQCDRIVFPRVIQ